MTLALPVGLHFGTVTGRLLGFDLQPHTGTATFTPSVPVILANDALNPATIVGPAVDCTLDADGVLRDADGAPSVQLIASDSPGLNPVGWTWTVAFNLTRGRREGFAFSLPTGTAVDLTSVAPVQESQGVTIIAGPPGAPGVSAYTLWLSLGNTGTEAEFLASLTGPAGPPGAGNVDMVNGQTGTVILDADDITDTSTRVAMTAAERTKLAGVQTGATKTAVVGDVPGLQPALDGKVDAVDVTSYVGAQLASTPLFLQHDGVTAGIGGVPVRPATTRPVQWFVPASAALPLTGSTAGGAKAAVAGLDIVSEY